MKAALDVLLRRCTAALFLAFAGVAVASAQTPAASPQDDASSPVRELLQRIQSAARTQDYAGVFAYQNGDALMSSRIVHVVDGTGERERLEQLDGEPREYLRHNEEVQCLIPRRKLVIRERGRSDRFPGMLIGDGADIDQQYQLRDEGELGRVAGRECRVYHLSPLDARRYGYRLCTDTATHLLLKAQIVNADQGVIDQIVFTSLQVGKDVSSMQLQSAWDTQGWLVQDTPTHATDLAAQGWRISIPSGYRTIFQLSRPMSQSRQVSQLVMSDGLAAISVFIEPVDVERHGGHASGATLRRGALSIHKTRIGDYWLTMMGEVPPQVLQELAERSQFVPQTVIADP